MSLKSHVSDDQQGLHELAEEMEEICFNIQSLTTEEIRCGCDLDDGIKHLKAKRALFNKKLKSLEESAETLRSFF
jgi:hypothetical protein